MTNVKQDGDCHPMLMSLYPVLCSCECVYGAKVDWSCWFSLKHAATLRHVIKRLNPDPHWENLLDPDTDPQIMNADPQPWFYSTCVHSRTVVVFFYIPTDELTLSTVSPGIALGWTWCCVTSALSSAAGSVWALWGGQGPASPPSPSPSLGS